MRDRILLMILGLLMGILFAVSLICKNPIQIIAVVLMCICVLVTAYFIRKIPKKSRIILLYILLLLVGYLLSSIYVCTAMGKIAPEEITPAGESEYAAVLLLSPGEVKEFHIQGAVYRLKATKDAYGLNMRWWNTPFKVYGVKKGLKKMNTGVYSETNQQLYNKLKDTLGEQFCVYNANMFGPPYIETVVEEILRAGHKKIVVVNNFLIRDPYREVIDSKIHKIIETSQANVEVLHTFPMWNHDALANMYENRIMEKIQENDVEKVGIILVTRGCSKKTLEKYEEAYKREEVFLNKIRESIVKNGYDGRKIKIAYLNYRDPDLKQTIDYLLDSGVSKLVVAAAGFENSSIQTDYLIPRIIEKFDIPPEIEVEYVGSWGDSDVLVKALVDRLRIVNIE